MYWQYYRDDSDSDSDHGSDDEANEAAGDEVNDAASDTEGADSVIHIPSSGKRRRHSKKLLKLPVRVMLAVRHHQMMAIRYHQEIERCASWVTVSNNPYVS